jgi:hypothetical protein
MGGLPRRNGAIVRPPVCRLLENCMLLNAGELAEVLIVEPWAREALRLSSFAQAVDTSTNDSNGEPGRSAGQPESRPIVSCSSAYKNILR